MRSRTTFSSRRGVAVIIAVSVLAILTLLIVGLGAFYQTTAGQETVGENRQASLTLIHTGLDYAQGLLAQKPAEILGRTLVLQLENAAVSVSGREAVPADLFYAGKFLDYRPGDAVLTIRVQHGQSPRITRLTQEFLANSTPGNERVVRIAERMAEQPVSAESDDPGTRE